MPLDHVIEERVNAMAEHTARLTGLVKEDYQQFCIKQIETMCQQQDSEPAKYIIHYWSMYENEVAERVYKKQF